MLKAKDTIAYEFVLAHEVSRREANWMICIFHRSELFKSWRVQRRALVRQ